MVENRQLVKPMPEIHGFRLVDTRLSPAQFEKISSIVYGLAGIRLGAGKEELVKARLLRRLRVLGLHNFTAYLEYLERPENAPELACMIDALTTNKTAFFREPDHFAFLTAHVLPRLEERKLRIWSAGCSTGEEPYSITMCLRDALPDFEDWDIKILATDIAGRVLEAAKRGSYQDEALGGLNPLSLQKYFTCTRRNPPRVYTVMDELRAPVRFAKLNLMGHWPMTGPFDVIFCRNVMIYFDRETQQQLVDRFYTLLSPGGYLFTGHSESLAGLSTSFHYVKPAVHKKL